MIRFGKEIDSSEQLGTESSHSAESLIMLFILETTSLLCFHLRPREPQRSESLKFFAGGSGSQTGETKQALHSTWTQLSPSYRFQRMGGQSQSYSPALVGSHDERTGMGSLPRTEARLRGILEV